MSILYIVGIGPGSLQCMTEQARQALEQAELICGYTAYVALVRPHWPYKHYLETGMRSETRRCKLALDAAQQQTVALVCSGDAGIYGLAGLALELAGEPKEGVPSAVEIEIIPGVTAATSGAALLGAPLTQDFAVISLSDLLTPWALIEKRLHGAALGDFVTVLYNPGSQKRTEHLAKACDILLAARGGETICGLTRNVGRAGEERRLLTLAELRETAVDMFTTVFVGNSATRVIGGKMVTGRGYILKHEV